MLCAMVKSRYIGDGHPTFNRNPYNWYIKPYYWVDDHPLLYGNNGSLDPSSYDITLLVDKLSRSLPLLSRSLPLITLPETNSKSPYKWMVGIRSFPIGFGLFSGAKTLVSMGFSGAPKNGTPFP